jgi:hypothetical protein
MKHAELQKRTYAITAEQYSERHQRPVTRFPLILVVSKKEHAKNKEDKLKSTTRADIVKNEDTYSDDEYDLSEPVLQPYAIRASYQRPQSAKLIRDTVRRILANNHQNFEIPRRPKSAVLSSKGKSNTLPDVSLTAPKMKKSGEIKRLTDFGAIAKKDLLVNFQAAKRASIVETFTPQFHSQLGKQQNENQLLSLKPFQVDNTGQKYVALLIVSACCRLIPTFLLFVTHNEYFLIPLSRSILYQPRS